MAELFAMKTPTGQLDPAKLKYPIGIQAKLDGVRAICINGVWYSFSGKPLWNTQNIDKHLEGVANGRVLDGEIIWPGHPFADAYGLLKRKKGGGITIHQSKELEFHVFDTLTLEEWRTKGPTRPYMERHMQLVKLFPDDCKVAIIVPMAVATDRAYLEQTYKQYIEEGYEGLMAKDLDGQYHWKRHPDWQRYKPVHTEDFRVTEIHEEISKAGFPKKSLGAVTVALGDGKTCKVGGGFNKGQRIGLWRHPEEILGRWIEVEFKLKTKDGSLREPVFVRLRPDKDE